MAGATSRRTRARPLTRNQSGHAGQSAHAGHADRAGRSAGRGGSRPVAGDLRSWLRRAPVAAAVASGMLLASIPVDANTPWSVSSAAGASAQSKAMSPVAPAGVKATCRPTTSRLVVSWAAAPHASAYRVYESETAGIFVAVTTTTATDWTTGQLTRNHSYTFEVSTLIGAAWASDPSSPSATRSLQGNHCG